MRSLSEYQHCLYLMNKVWLKIVRLTRKGRALGIGVVTSSFFSNWILNLFSFSFFNLHRPLTLRMAKNKDNHPSQS